MSAQLITLASAREIEDSEPVADTKFDDGDGGGGGGDDGDGEDDRFWPISEHLWTKMNRIAGVLAEVVEADELGARDEAADALTGLLYDLRLRIFEWLAKVQERPGLYRPRT